VTLFPYTTLFRSDTYSAHQGVENDDMNALVLGARIIGPALAFEVVDAYVGAKFNTTEPRYTRRFNKVKAIEAKYMCGDGSANPA
jgi:ribose 5-phosphate isomerase B